MCLLNLEDMKKEITVAKGEKSGVRGKLSSVPFDFDNLMVNIAFVVIQNLPLDGVIGRQNINLLVGVRDFQVEEVRLSYRGSDATLPMQSEYARPLLVDDNTDSENLTSYSDGSSSGGEKNDVEDEEYVVMIQGKDMKEEEKQ